MAKKHHSGDYVQVVMELLGELGDSDNWGCLGCLALVVIAILPFLLPLVGIIWYLERHNKKITLEKKK